MRILLIAFLATASVFGQAFDRVAATNTQAILRFTGVTAPGSCGLEASESASFTALLHDVDTALYSGADKFNRSGNIVDGTTVYFVLGHRTYATASDSKVYSQALPANSLIYWRGTGACSSLSGHFMTDTIRFGSTRGEALPVAAPGTYAYPTINWSDQNDSIIDAQSGVKYFRMTGPNGSGTPIIAPFASVTGSGWTNKDNALVADSNYATISDSTNPLYFDWDHNGYPLGPPTFDGQAFDYVQVEVQGKASSSINIEVCISVDQGGNCKSQWKTLLLTTSDQTLVAGTTTPIDTLGAVPPITKQQVTAYFGQTTYDSATKILRASTVSSIGHSGRADGFDINWRVGSNVRVYGAAVVITDIGAGSNPTVTTYTNHGLTTGDTINIAGNLGGTSGALGTWTVTVTGLKTFTLDGATTSGSYSSPSIVSPGTAPWDTAAGSPPRIYIANSFWNGGGYVKFLGCVDSGWTSLNGNSYAFSSYNGSTEVFNITGATTTGTYTGGCNAYRLQGIVQKVDQYPIASVDNTKQITLTSGPASDITGSQDIGVIYVNGGVANVCIAPGHSHDLDTSATLTISGASPSSFNGSKTISDSVSGYGPQCFKIGATAETDGAYTQSGATFTTVYGGYTNAQDYEYHPSGVRLRMKSGESGTISINRVAAKYITSQGIGWPAGGGGFTHRVPVANYYLGAIGEVNLWGFKTDGTEAKWFGEMRIQDSPFFQCLGGNFDTRDPLTYYCMTPIAPYTMIKSTLNFDGTDANASSRLPRKLIPLCSNENVPPCWGPWVDITPGGLAALARGTDPTYWDDMFPLGANCFQASGGYVQATNSVHIALQCGASNQNGGLVWYVLDLGNQIPYGQTGSTMRVIARRDTWSGKQVRWTGVHGGGMRGFPESGIIGYSAHPMNNGLFDTGPGTQDWFGPYKTTYSGSPMTSTSWGSCAAFAGNPLLPSVIPTGAGCETRTVQGEPCDDSPGPQETARIAAHTSLMTSKCGRSSAHYLQDAIVGDLFVHNDGFEVMQLIDKGFDSKTWTFYRGAFYGYYNLGVDKGANTHSNNLIYAWYNTPDHTYNIKSGSVAWDYMSDPYPTSTHDTNYQPRDISDGHGWEGWLAEARSGVSSPLCGSYCVGVRQGPFQVRNPTVGFNAVVSMSGSFAGQPGKSFPNEVDSHSTMAQTSDGADQSWWIDGRPMLSAGSPAASSVSGQRYKWNAGTGRPLKQKFFEIMAYAGNNPIKDISGPGSTLGTTSSDSYKGCLTLIADECVSGAQPGDYFINAPQVSTSAAIYQCCGADVSRLRDIGWTNAYAQSHQMSQTLMRNDAFGLFTRNLGRGLLQYRLFDTFYNLTETSDGRTGMVRAVGLGGIRNDAISFRLPVVQTDSVFRNTFIGVPTYGMIPDTATHTRIKFGYDPDYHCTTRNDPCYAVANHVNENVPFLFGAELLASSGVGLGSRSPEIAPLRIDSGWNADYTDANGNIWKADPYWGTPLPPGQSCNSGAPVSGTVDDQLYYSCFASATTITYTASLPASTTYDVTLKWNEVYWGGPGGRSFNVVINGVTKDTGLDPIALAGGNYIAYDKTYTGIPVVGGQIQVQLVPTGGLTAFISAIQIAPSAPSPTDRTYLCVIPAISSRVLYYLIEHVNDSGTVVATEGPKVMVVR